MLDQNKEIHAFWQSELITLPEEKLADFQLPEETHQFLTQVGLPLKGAPLAKEMEELLNIKFFNEVDSIFVLSVEQRNFLFIASDPICSYIKIGIEEQSGNVFHIIRPPHTDDIEATFINSNIIAFLLYFQIYFTNHIQPLSNADYRLYYKKKREANKLKKKFREVDAKALDRNDNFWSEVVEEVGYGMI